MLVDTKWLRDLGFVRPMAVAADEVFVCGKPVKWERYGSVRYPLQLEKRRGEKQWTAYVWGERVAFDQQRDSLVRIIIGATSGP